MKFRISTLILIQVLSVFSACSSNTQSTLLKANYLNYTYFYQSSASNRSLIIFLHGGVNNPYFDTAKQIQPEYLLEGNSYWLDEVKKQEFDLLLPVTKDSFEWLNHLSYTKVILDSMLMGLGTRYNQILITGFSDGGTGAYKLFYSYKKDYDGLIVFNGYPQHKNFHKSVRFDSISKPVIFMGKLGDNTIPYEFLLGEYCNQKKFNSKTYLYIGEGEHNFQTYDSTDLALVFELLKDSGNQTESEPIHGFTKAGQLIDFYIFRKKIIRKYGYDAELIAINRRQKKGLKK